MRDIGKHFIGGNDSMYGRYKNIIMVLAVILASILFLGVSSAFVQYPFELDDNRNQWLPILDKSFEQLFSTGRIPAVDFYQMKGLNILDSGYYSLLNPIMLVSYILRYSILEHVGLDTISLYIYMVFTLGNVCIFTLVRCLTKNTWSSILAVVLSSCACCFIHYGYWYYVYNNYLMIPLIIWTIILAENTRLGYFLTGFVLAFDILLGNVQYTVYHYIFYGIVMLVFALLANKKYFGMLVTNTILGIFLSSPVLLLLLQASARTFTTASSGEFFVNGIGIVAGLFFWIFPSDLVSKIAPSIYSFIQNNFNHETFMVRNMALYSGLTGIMVLLLCISLIRDKKSYFSKINEKDKTVVWVIALLASGGFFALLSMGKHTPVGMAMSFFPVVNKFRYPFKAIFVSAPAFAICATLFISMYHWKNVMIVSACIISLFTSVMQNRTIFQSGILAQFASSAEPELKEIEQHLESMVEKANLDLANYRICTFLRYTQKQGSPWQDSVAYAGRLDYTFLRNTPTLIQAFALAGYDINYAPKGYIQSNAIMQDPVFEYRYSGGISTYAFLNRMQDEVQRELFIQQLQDNGVKYLLFDVEAEEDMGQISRIIAESDKLYVMNVIAFAPGKTVLELGGIPALCSSNWEMVNLNSEMDRLYFETDGISGQYRLSFTYSENYVADFVDENGSKKQLSLEPDEKGFIVVSQEVPALGKVTIRYSNPLVNMAILVSPIICMGVILALGTAVRMNGKKSEDKN